MTLVSTSSSGLVSQPALQCLMDLVRWRSGDPDAVLLATRLNPHAAMQPMSDKQCQQALNTAASEMDEPALGLYLGSQWFLSCYDLVNRCTDNSPDLLTALQRLCTLLAQHMPLLQFDLDHHADLTRLSISATQPVQKIEPILLEFSTSLINGVLAYISDNRCHPQEVQLDFTEPAHQALYTVFFACPVNFHCSQNQLLFNRKNLSRPLSQRNLDAPFCVQIEHLLTHVRGRYPNIEQVAERMALSARTLRRRLRDEGWSYQQLVEQWRQQKALEYLLNTRLTVQQVGYVLGYSDPANFGRAFRQWFGKSPRRFREGRGQYD